MDGSFIMNWGQAMVLAVGDTQQALGTSWDGIKAGGCPALYHQDIIILLYSSWFPLKFMGVFPLTAMGIGQAGEFSLHIVNLECAGRGFIL